MESWLVCSKCGSGKLSIFWRYKDEDELTRLTLCHDGWGLRVEDAMFTCCKCGHTASYEDEDFLKIKDKDALQWRKNIK